jgi:hypothetical protein
MLVEVEARVLEGVVVQMDKNEVLTQGFKTEPGGVGQVVIGLKVQVEIVSGGTNFGPQKHSCVPKGLPWSC